MQQYCIKWNNHMRNFQLTLPKYFQNQKFLDCTLLVEGKHLVPCHKFVLDACSDYFASFLKNKLFDDKNLVICLPKEIKLWEIQALLQFMYHGEVCISQEGLSTLVKCAELLQVKGLCGNETASIISKDKDPLAQSKNKASEEPEPAEVDCVLNNSVESERPEVDANGSDLCEYNNQMIIKREININDVDSINNEEQGTPEGTSKENSSSSSPKGLIRVKRNLFEAHNESDAKKQCDEATNSLVYNKKSMDIYVKPTSKDSEIDESSRCSSPLLVEHDQDFENIVCSPTLIQYHYSPDNPKPAANQTENPCGNIVEGLDDYDDDDDDDLFIEEANVCSNDALYNMITQKFENCESFPQNNEDSELKRKLLISSVGSLNRQYQDNELTIAETQNADQSNEMKVAIGGLYLRNPRGNQVRQYDVNALYSALQDVKNGHSIYRAAQTYSIPRKTLRNWMKRLHIKSQFPMPKQLKQAAERKKNSQVKPERSSSILLNAIELS